MNIKYLFLTFALLPTLSLADTPAQPIEKQNDNATGKAVAATTGMLGAMGLIVGAVGIGDAHRQLQSLVKEHIKNYMPKNVLDQHVNNLVHEHTADLLVHDIMVPTTPSRIESVSISKLIDIRAIKYDQRQKYMAAVFFGGVALAFISLATVWSLLSTRNSKNETQEKPVKVTA